MNEIGEILQSSREKAGVSIEEASKDLGVKAEIITNIEEGKAGAFKDIYELKEYISAYAKYLGLDVGKIIDEFNEYMFEYTSKIPIKEIEKTIEIKIKEDKTTKVASPYTKASKKHNSFIYVMIYILVFLMLVLVIVWSVKQVTIDQIVTTSISYRR